MNMQELSRLIWEKWRSGAIDLVNGILSDVTVEMLMILVCKSSNIL